MRDKKSFLNRGLVVLNSYQIRAKTCAGQRNSQIQSRQGEGMCILSAEKQAGVLEKTRKDGRTAPKMQINQPRFYEKREAADNPERTLLPQRWK